MIDNEFPQSSPPINTNKSTGDKMERSAMEAIDYRTQERIKKVWQPVLEDNNFIKELPISRQAKHEESYKNHLYPDQFISVPLNGGGEIRLSRESVVMQSGHEGSTLILGIKTTNAKGEDVSIPEFELSKYGNSPFGYKVDDFLSPNSFRDQKDLLGETRKGLTKEANRFLTLFNPQKDIDLQKLPQPTPAQTSCLKAFGVARK